MAVTDHRDPSDSQGPSRLAAAQDPRAPAGGLMVLAANHADLRPVIASNPACPPELRDWITQQGAADGGSTGSAGGADDPCAADAGHDSLAPLGWEPSDLDAGEDLFGSVLGDPLMGSPLFDDEAPTPPEQDPAPGDDRPRAGHGRRRGSGSRHPSSGRGAGSRPAPAVGRPAPAARPAAAQQPAPHPGHGAPMGPPGPHTAGSQRPQPSGYPAAPDLGALMWGAPGTAGAAGWQAPGTAPARGDLPAHPAATPARGSAVPRAVGWAALLGLVILIRACAG